MSLPPVPTGLDVDASLVPTAVPVEGVLRALSLSAIILRYVARRAGGLHFWWDDWAIFVLGVVLIPATIWKMFLYSIGLGRHIWWVAEEETLDTFAIYAKLSYVDLLHYAPSVMLIKLSILALYVRIFSVRKSFVRFCYAQMALAVAWTVVSEFFWIFRCSPIWMAWQPIAADGACRSVIATFIPTTSVAVVGDWLILATPMYMVWTLQLSTRKKLLVGGVLMLGAGECIFSTVRIIKTAGLPFVDSTWDRGIMSMWCSPECDLGIVCVCFPTFGTLLPSRWKGSVTGSSGPDSTRNARGRSYDGAPIHRAVPKAPTKSLDSDSDRTSPVRHELVGTVPRGPYDIVRTTEVHIEQGRDMSWE